MRNKRLSYYADTGFGLTPLNILFDSVTNEAPAVLVNFDREEASEFLGATSEQARRGVELSDHAEKTLHIANLYKKMMWILQKLQKVYTASVQCLS